MKRKLPSPITILMFVIVIAALATWLIPAGSYDTIAYKEGEEFILKNGEKELMLPFNQHTLDSVGIKISLEKFNSGAIRKPVSIPGSYQQQPANRQGFIEILQAPIRGVYESIDIIFFILIIGAFMNVFNSSGAMIKGLTSLSYIMQGREAWLIIILTFLFSFAGASYGMAEEGLAFYAVMVPLFLAAGYDLLVPVAVIFAGTQLGTLSSFTNPFSTIIASNAAGINWTEGLLERIVMFILTTAVSIWYIVRYAQKVKADPTASLVYRYDNVSPTVYPVMEKSSINVPLDKKTKLLLFIFFATFLVMVAGVVMYDWWLLEMTALFLGATILLAFVMRSTESDFMKHFMEGASGLVSVGIIVGVARGVTLVLNDGHISDSILFYSAKFAGTMPPVLFIIVMLLLYMLFTLFIASSSGMAVLTMPIMGGLAMLVNVPGREIVNAYLFGMGIMGFITPTGLILPSLALVNVSLKTWWKFIYPLMIILFVMCAICLSIGVFFK